MDSNTAVIFCNNLSHPELEARKKQELNPDNSNAYSLPPYKTEAVLFNSKNIRSSFNDNVNHINS